MPHIGLAEIDELESIVDAFESTRQGQGRADLADFLPDSAHPRYLEIAAELVRVDMELSWNDGSRQDLDSYCRLIPDLASDPDTLAKVAYEEYRLRVLQGETVKPEEYSRRFGFSTAAWKRLVAPAGKLHQASDQSSVSKTFTAAWSNALQLADDITEFPECGADFLGFHLEREIGRGAFARVFLARQGELADRYVVLKVAAGRTLEPQHLARLQHTNIVPIYSVHQAGRLTAVCMPYFGNRTLADFVQSLSPAEGLPKSGQAFLSTLTVQTDETHVPRSPDLVTKAEKKPVSAVGCDRLQIERLSRMSYVTAVTGIVAQIAEGLLHAHQRGIVHRDLKLANILLTDDGNALILDFNLSEELVVNGPTALAVGGTLPYMAPEHLKALLHGGSVDLRSDIYSLGVIFFELLTGKQPFPVRRGALELVVDQMLQDRQKQTPSLAGPGLKSPAAMSPDIESIVSRCLAPRLEERYQSVAELHEDLARHLADLPLRYAANNSLVERFKKWTRRHPRLSSAASVATIAAVLLVTAGWLSLRLWANNSYQQFAANLPAARAALSIPENDVELINDGMATTRAALKEYGVGDDAAWHRPFKYYLVESANRVNLQLSLSELAYQMAVANQRLAESDNDVAHSEEALQWNELASSLLAGQQEPRAFRLQRAELLEATGETAAANDLRTSAAELSPQGPLDELLYAQRLVSEKQFTKALTVLTNLRDHGPNDAVVLLLMGFSYAGMGKFDRAEECFSMSAAVLPESYLALHHRGLCRMDLHQFELAKEDFDAVIKMRSDLPPCLLNRALAQAALGNHAAAIADYTTALEHGASYPRIYFLRARSHESLGDSESAAKDRAMGLSLVPSDEESWVARGIARLSKDPQGALADFQEALNLNSRSVLALQNIVYISADILDREPDALDALNRILEIDARNADALAGRAVLFARQGDRPQALANIQELLRVSREPVHLFQAACALTQTSTIEPGDIPKALQALSNAVLQDPRLLVRAQTDKDLDELRKHAGYENLLKAVATAPKK